MNFKIETIPRFEKDVKKLKKIVQEEIGSY
jgi:hypothetical protein